MDCEPLQIRLNQLLRLGEDRNRAYEFFQHRHKILKKWFDKKKSFQVKFKLEDLVLKWDEDRVKPEHYQKFGSLWSRPYIIIDTL